MVRVVIKSASVWGLREGSSGPVSCWELCLLRQNCFGRRRTRCSMFTDLYQQWLSLFSTFGCLELDTSISFFEPLLGIHNRLRRWSDEELQEGRVLDCAHIWPMDQFQSFSVKFSRGGRMWRRRVSECYHGAYMHANVKENMSTKKKTHTSSFITAYYRRSPTLVRKWLKSFS